MTKTNTKSTSTKNVAKTEAPKTKVRKASPTREAYNILTSELKKLTAEKKNRKSELLKKIDALWTEYKKYSKEEYKPARKAAIDKFIAVKTEAAKSRASKKAENTAKKVEKAAAKPAKKAVKKAAPKAEAPAAEVAIAEAK